MLNGVPETFEEAVQEISDELNESELPTEQANVAFYHHGYGTALRNEWGLWTDSVLAKHMKQRFGIGHADDMSGLIMGKAFADYRGEEFDIDAEIQRYKEHWKRLKVDPLT
jgi:hypothetical protein